MSDDTRTRLQAAIMAAREAIWDVGKRPAVMTVPEAVVRYAALVALAARYDQHYRDGMHIPGECELDAEVARLLAVDGPTEAHSARKQDQPSG